MKRLLTVQDISCIGNCSATIALPVLAALGVETALLPTALLSTHTAFPNPTFIDLTDEIPKIAKHWETMGFKFDGFLSGYLGSVSQIRMIESVFETFQTEKQPIFVDPVMGDHGKLYSGFSESFAREMRSLCGKADVLFPNLTEACLLAGVPYREDMMLEEKKDLIRSVAECGCKSVILTGVSASTEQTGALVYDARNDTFSLSQAKRYPNQYHGTGDLFACTVAGLVLSGKSIEASVDVAVRFVSESVRCSMEHESSKQFGVAFEQALPYLYT